MFLLWPGLPFSSEGGSLIPGNGGLQHGSTRIDVFDLDRLGRVIEDGLGRRHLDGGWRILVDFAV